MENGRELQRMQNKLGLSPTEVCTEAQVSMTTLYAVYANKDSVKTKSVIKVREALQRLTKSPSVNKSKAVG